MNPWDVFTWLCAVALAGTAVVIFGYFLRDAGSILNREMHASAEPSAGEEPSAGKEPSAGGEPSAGKEQP